MKKEMKKLNTQYKSVAIVAIFWHHLLQWLRLLVLALTRTRERRREAVFHCFRQPQLISTKPIFQYQNILK
jgi:hypothetical protein